jgi:hypothetical protein
VCGRTGRLGTCRAEPANLPRHGPANVRWLVGWLNVGWQPTIKTLALQWISAKVGYVGCFARLRVNVSV